jgi:hypothetical protein
MNRNDCNHTAMRIEPGRFRCSGCGTEFDRKTPAEHIAAMRDVLAHKRFRPKPVVPDTAPPPPIPRKDHP